MQHLLHGRVLHRHFDHGKRGRLAAVVQRPGVVHAVDVHDGHWPCGLRGPREGKGAKELRGWMRCGGARVACEHCKKKSYFCGQVDARQRCWHSGRHPPRGILQRSAARASGRRLICSRTWRRWSGLAAGRGCTERGARWCGDEQRHGAQWCRGKQRYVCRSAHLLHKCAACPGPATSPSGRGARR